jgi:hypothetical protein
MRTKTAIIFHVWLTLVRVSNPAGVIIVEEAPGECLYRTIVCMNIHVKIADFPLPFFSILRHFRRVIRNSSERNFLSRHTAVVICYSQLIHDTGKIIS